MLWSFYSQEIFICLPNSLVDIEMSVVKRNVGVVKNFRLHSAHDYVYGPPQPSRGSYTYE